MTDSSLRLIRPQWTRDERDGWDVYSVDRYTYRYAEAGRAVDVPIERGWAPDGRAMIEIYPEQLTWRQEDGAGSPVTAEEQALVVDRLSAGLAFQGVVPVVRSS